MLTDDELYKIREMTDNNFSIIVTKIIDLFDIFNYVAYLDEFTEIMDNGLLTNNTFKNDIHNNLYFHMYRVGIMLNLSFSPDGSLSDRYFILKAIKLIPDLDNVIKEDLTEILTIDDCNLEILTMILSDIIEYDIDIYTAITTVDDALIDTISSILKNSSVEVDIEYEILVAKKISIFKETLGEKPNVNIIKYISNYENNMNIDVMSILFKDKLSSLDSDELVNVVISLLVFSNTTIEERNNSFSILAKYITNNKIEFIEIKINKLLNNFTI